MRKSKYGFLLPDYPDEADIPSLVAVNVELMERLYDKMQSEFERKQFTQSRQIYASLGVAYYDGGSFSDTTADTALDGGYFTDSDTTVIVIDCGAFEPLIAAICREYCPCDKTTRIIDGGGFDNLTGEVIDCGGYDNLTGEVIDCGIFSRNYK